MPDDLKIGDTVKFPWFVWEDEDYCMTYRWAYGEIIAITEDAGGKCAKIAPLLVPRDEGLPIYLALLGAPCPKKYRHEADTMPFNELVRVDKAVFDPLREACRILGKATALLSGGPKPLHELQGEP